MSTSVRFFKRPGPLPGAKGIIFSLLCFLFFSQSACTEDPPPILGPDDLKLIDSLYQKEVIKLKPVLDSICDANHDSLVNMAIDSMLNQRIAEIEKQLEQIRRQQ